MIKTLLLVVGSILGIFVLGMIITAATMTEQERQAYQAQRQINASCDATIADSALGAERRNLRAICDEVKALAEKRVRDASSH